MIAVRYTRKDIALIREWYLDREMNPPTTDEFPTVGFIVESIAAGFLYKTDSSICLFEGVITNKECSAKQRNEALCLIAIAVLKAAKDFGFKKIFAFSEEETMIQRARELGFSIGVKHQSMVKEL